MSESVTARIDFTGPFFTKDPEKTILENVEKMMHAFADEGATAARQGLMSGAGERAPVRALGGRVADHVVGRVQSRVGVRWQTAAVVQVFAGRGSGLSKEEGVSLMAAAAHVERKTRAIRSVTRQLRAARSVLRANLTAGLE